MLLNCGVREDSWESLGLQGDQTNRSYRKSVLNIHWKDWCWSWSSSTLATRCEEQAHWKRPWCWERLRAGGQRMRWLDDITKSMVMSFGKPRNWWWTRKPGMLQSMGSQRVRHNWATELNWFIGSTDAEAEAPILWSPDVKSWLIGKDPDVGERLKAEGEKGNRGWDGWMASLTGWTWVWASSRSWWWTGRPGVLQPMGSQRVGHDWAAEMNWTEQI